MGTSITMFEALEVRTLMSGATAAAEHVAAGGVAAALHAPPAKQAAPTPTEGGTTLAEPLNKRFTARLGEVTVKAVDLSLSVVVRWGDGTRSAGTLQGSYATGEYYVFGTHTYHHADTYKVTVQVFAHVIGSPVVPTSPIRQFVSVIKAGGNAKPPTDDGGVTLNEVATQKFTANVGEFTYKTVDQLLSADINWGDGTHSAGTLVGSYATGHYYVQGSHTYAHTGEFDVHVKIFGRLPGSPVTPTSPLREFHSTINVLGAA